MNSIDKEIVREGKETFPVQSDGEAIDLHADTPRSFWEKVSHKLRDGTSTPDWLPHPWNYAAMGYLLAIILPTLAALLMVFVVKIFPTFSMIGAFTILSIAGIALLWGTGPGLLATLVGALLLNFISISPSFSLSLTPQNLIETLLFLGIGIAISFMTSRIEKLRTAATTANHEAEIARSHIHDLFTQSADRTNQLEAIFEAITDGVFIVDANGTPPRLNRAARKLLAIPPGTPDEALHKYPFQLLDEQGTPLPRNQWPQTRLLQGKRLQGNNAVDILLRAYNGRTRLLSVTGSPLRNADGSITSTVMVCRDVTERRRLEQHNREALNGMLEMTQFLVQTPEEAFPDGKGLEDRDTGNIAQKLTKLSRNVLGCERLSITAIDPETGLMHPLSVIGLTPEQEKQWRAEQEQQQNSFTESPDPEHVARLLAGEVLLIDMNQPPYNEKPNPYGITTLLVAPMKIGDHLAGLITLDYGGADHTYTSDELSIAGATAKFTATIIERERLLHQQRELRASEIELRNANQRMADLIALAHDAIFVRTPEGVILSWNQGAEQLYGWTAKQAIGQVKYDHLQTRAPLSREALEASLERFGRWEGQLIHTKRDGRQVIVDSRQALVRDEAGRPNAILEINRDISDLEQLTRERAEAYARELSMRETKERMDEFLGITSHELRTPLTTIKGNIQLAKLRMKHVARLIQKTENVPGSDLEEIQTMLDRAERQVNVQGRLIRDLLDISRIQVGKLELDMELCDLLTIVRETVEDQRSASPKRNVTLILSEEEMPIIADAERIGQVVSNYLTNALKYSPPDRSVVVTVEREGDMARVAVRDQGPGLTPAEQQQVWDRFYKVPGVERQKGFSAGLGLGLHICRAIIEEHQGEIGVESAKGAGSTFWFTLPLAEAVIEEAAAETQGRSL